MNLCDNIILYAGILEVKRMGGHILYEDDYAILVKEPEMNLLMFAALNQDAARQAMTFFPAQPLLVCAHDSYTKACVEDIYDMEPGLICYQCTYTKQEPIAYTLPQGYTIKAPSVEHIPDMITLYQEHMPDLAHKEAFLQAMKRGMFALFYEEHLCGFIGLHEEGSMGMLEIAPVHRKAGLATALESHMINHQLEKHAIPYGQVVYGNQVSIHLQKTLGLQIAQQLTYWYFWD